MNYRADFHAPFSFVGTDCADIKSGAEKYNNPPVSGFQFNFVQNFGFLINIYTDEKHPVKKTSVNGKAVCDESTFTLIANFVPDNSDKYIKFVFGAGGGFYACSIDCDGAEEELKDFYNKADVTVSVRDEGWDVTALIPLDLIAGIYGNIEFKPGYTFKANFSKDCPEVTSEHHISWSPEFFGTVTLDRSIEKI